MDPRRKCGHFRRTPWHRRWALEASDEQLFAGRHPAQILPCTNGCYEHDTRRLDILNKGPSGTTSPFLSLDQQPRPPNCRLECKNTCHPNPVSVLYSSLFAKVVGLSKLQTRRLYLSQGSQPQRHLRRQQVA